MPKFIVLIVYFIVQFLCGQSHGIDRVGADSLLPPGQRIDHLLQESAKNGYSGSVLVAKDGVILLSRGYGWADRDKNIPNEPSTLFNIGSVTKQFTAAAILKLMEDKRLDVSDKLIDYFPQVPPDKQDITLHQLLTHTSGISPGTGGFRYHEASKEQFLKECFQSELMYPPGSKHTYANANYILLAAIVEIASKQDFEAYMRHQFWSPLNMERTGYKKVYTYGEQFALGYQYDHNLGEWKDWGITLDHLPGNDNHWYSIGKGDLYSTTEDLYKWHMALEGNRVLRAESKQLMEMAHIPENPGKTSHYGYGWAILNTSANGKIVTHNGSNGVYFADFVRYLEEDLTVIALSNAILNPQSENVAWEIASMVLDDQHPASVIPKNSYELVFDFMSTHSPDEADQLLPFLERHIGARLTDKALLNRMGYQRVSEKSDPDWGLALLRLNTDLFPEDGNLWDSLGEGYFLVNNKVKAIESFEKALELSPEDHCHWCENSRRRLAELAGK
jgi:CubicO group peptidase (beta-lactamase class C family)